MGRTRRLPCALLLALACACACVLPLLVACGGEPPRVLVVESLDETQLLFLEATSTVGDPYRDAQVLRTVSLAPDGERGYLLSPRDVYVHGELYATAEDGTRYVGAQACGLDRSAQAACQPHLTPFWASARARPGPGPSGSTSDAPSPPDRLDFGLLLPDGTLFGPSRAPADIEPSIDDAVPFLLRRVPDEVLALVALNAHGAWAPGSERTTSVEVGRGAVLEPLAGTLTLRRVGGRGWKLHLEVDWRAEGKVATWLAWRVEHKVSGTVGVRGDGRLSGGSLASRTRVLDGAKVVGTARHRLEVSETVPSVYGHEADDLAALLALRATDHATFQKAVLAQSAASARALVQRVRPDADLEHVSHFLSDQVDPSSWPTGRASATAGFDAAILVWRRWARSLDRLVGSAVAPADAPPDAEAEWFGEGRWEPEDQDSAYSWTQLGALTAGRNVISDLQVLSHEYAHFANERFGYPDLARTGYSWDAAGPAWIDLDGLLALTLLEEAQAEATAYCAVLACFEASEQRDVVWWYAKQDTTPIHERDFRKRILHLAYGSSPAVLAEHCDVDDDLESVIRKTWAAWAYQTRSFLFPRDPLAPSRLWPRAAALKEQGAVDATRVGAFALLYHLDATQWARRTEDLKIVRALRDDVLVASAEGGLLWITSWQDEAAAQRFLGRVRRASAGVAERAGHRVIVRAGAVPRAAAWQQHLLGGTTAPNPER